MNVSSNFNSVYDSRNFGTFSKTLKSFKDILRKIAEQRQKQLVFYRKNYRILEPNHLQCLKHLMKDH